MKLEKNIPQDRLDYLITYFEDYCYTNDSRYSNVDFSKLFIYEYPIFLENCTNFINTLNSENHIKDELEQIYSILFNTQEEEQLLLISQLKKNNLVDLHYVSKDKTEHKLSFFYYENEYFCLTQENGVLDIKILISNNLFKEERYDASVSYLKLLKHITKNITLI